MTDRARVHMSKFVCLKLGGLERLFAEDLGQSETIKISDMKINHNPLLIA